MSAAIARRRAGLLIPLFSSPSAESWGVGDIGDVSTVTTWLAAAGQRVLQLLPLNEMAPGQHSPYSAISAMAIDPIFIQMRAVPEWWGVGGEPSLSDADRDSLDRVRLAPRVEYASIRSLKETALSASFERFYDCEWRFNTPRAGLLKAFVSAQGWWVDDHALFHAIRAGQQNRPWMEWPEPLQLRHPEAMDRARKEYERDVLFHQYVQWIADGQWQAARQAAHAHDVQLFGDLPFMVDADSADVWANRQSFRLDVSVGAPPDAFSETGQDWGMPLYDWDAVAGDNFRWLRARARRNWDLYDGYRVDHLVGFYRTFGRPHNRATPFFSPATEPEQIALGERVLQVFKASGAEIIAEDLGSVPEFVRTSMSTLAVPGFCVLRWERHWRVEGQPFRDPAAYPANSVAASGTHDTEPLAVWWENASEADQRQLNSLETIQHLTRGAGVVGVPYDPLVRDTLLEALFASGSNLLMLPVQDVFGWRDRINEPSIVNDSNWTFRLPWPCDRLDEILEARERQAQLRAWAERYSRW